MHKDQARSFGTHQAYASSGSKIMHDLHDLKDDARVLKNDIRNATHNATEEVRHRSAQIRDVAGAVIAAPGTVSHYVQTKPFKAAFMALAVGYLFGRVYRA